MFDFKKLFGRKSKDRVEVPHWSSNGTLRQCLHSLRGECTIADGAHHEAASAAVFLANQEDRWAEVLSLRALPESWNMGKVYILWADEALPSVCCTAAVVFEQLEEVTKVTDDFYLVSESMDRILHISGNHLRSCTISSAE